MVTLKGANVRFFSSIWKQLPGRNYRQVGLELSPKALPGFGGLAEGATSSIQNMRTFYRYLNSGYV